MEMNERATHDNDSAGDGDRSQRHVRDGVRPYRVTDALVLAVDRSLVWPGRGGHYNEGQRSYRNKKKRR